MPIRRLLRHHLFMSGLALFLVVLVAALAADLIASQSPTRMNMRLRFTAPGGDRFLLGSDAFGRDVLARLVHGAQVSLRIGLLVVVVSGVLGTFFGAVAGYFRRLDNPLMRVMDAFMAFPAILLAIAIAAALGPSELNVVIALAAVYTPRTARIVRASVLVVREAEYVLAARTAGAGHTRILLGHILPNSLAPLIVQLTFIFAYAVLAEAVLSFLGVGPAPPTPTWGNMIADGRNFIREAPWITLMPGIAISITVLGLNLIGDGLRDVFDPRMKVASS
ncbi:MAG: ABC transporter permease [Alphaproteobacteria bacterium]|nr:ABC transporter permease [Alphaproteobacteria bacterium]